MPNGQPRFNKCCCNDTLVAAAACRGLHLGWAGELQARGRRAGRITEGNSVARTSERDRMSRHCSSKAQPNRPGSAGAWHCIYIKLFLFNHIFMSQHGIATEQRLPAAPGSTAAAPPWIGCRAIMRRRQHRRAARPPCAQQTGQNPTAPRRQPRREPSTAGRSSYSGRAATAPNSPPPPDQPVAGAQAHGREGLLQERHVDHRGVQQRATGRSPPTASDCEQSR